MQMLAGEILRGSAHRFPDKTALIAGERRLSFRELDEAADRWARLVARFKRPRRIEIVADLPKTAVGKVQKNLLREPYWRGRERKI
jgi:non-ribosomal peptide synthetase component E (peptide arylation enzyme)